MDDVDDMTGDITTTETDNLTRVSIVVETNVGVTNRVGVRWRSVTRMNVMMMRVNMGGEKRTGTMKGVRTRR